VQLGDESYALPVESVHEVADLDGLTPVPRAPAPVLGVCNLRGNVLPVVDLGSILGSSPTETPRRIVVAEHRDRRAALAVGGVTGVEELAGSPEPAESDHLAGSLIVGGALVGVVELESVLRAVEEAQP